MNSSRVREEKLSGIREAREGRAFWGATIGFLAVMAGSGAPSMFLADYQARWHFPTSDLSIAFAIYALGLVLVLVAAGSVSDRIGRRPCSLGALALTAVAMVVFLTAQDVGALIVARAIQGVATGIATTVFSASIVELAPGAKRRVAELIVTITTAGGLGIGVVVAGGATETMAEPQTVVFGAIIAVVAIAAVAVAMGPETAPKFQAPKASPIPRRRVGGAGGSGLMRLAPGIIAIWMSAGLVLGLGASLASSILHLGNGLAASLVVAAQPLTATICTIVVAPRFAPGRLIPAGLVCVLVGVAAEGAAFQTNAAALAVIGAVITGLGFGAVFSGTLRLLLPRVVAEHKAAFFASFYLVGYLAYGVSAVAAGLLSDNVGLNPAAITYAVATIAVAAVALPLAVVGGRVADTGREP